MKDFALKIVTSLGSYTKLLEQNATPMDLAFSHYERLEGHLFRKAFKMASYET